jgi:hypothetical protein
MNRLFHIFGLHDWKYGIVQSHSDSDFLGYVEYVSI